MCFGNKVKKRGTECMKHLNDDALLQAYEMAIRLRLEQEFIDLLLAEINRRGLRPPDATYPEHLKERIAAYGLIAV